MTIDATQNGPTQGRPKTASETGANIGETERWASALGGSLMVLAGLSRSTTRGAALAALGAGLVYRGLTGHSPLYTALGVSTIHPRSRTTSVPAGTGIKIQKSIHIKRSAADLYRYWRSLENLPRFMRHIKSVTIRGNVSRWVARGPLGLTLKWDAVIINDHPSELIAWRSLEGSDVDNAGSVHFFPTEVQGGTRVTVILKYALPAGRMGEALAHMLGQDPETQIEEDLLRFKNAMETEYLATTLKKLSERNKWPSP